MRKSGHFPMLTIMSGVNGLTYGLAVCIFLVCICQGLDHTKTYTHTLSNGQSVTCNLCKPGEKFVSHCTRDGGDAICEPCSTGTYNTHYTRAINCAPCDTQCKYPQREEVEKNCTTTSNISCICRDGYYRDKGDNVCLVQKGCPPGQGVHTQGDRFTKVVCEPCSEGYYSNITSTTMSCTPCSICSKNEVILTECSPLNDTLCGPREPINKDNSTNVGLIVGCSVAAFVFLIVLIIVTCICRNKARRNYVKKRCLSCIRDSDKPLDGVELDLLKDHNKESHSNSNGVSGSTLNEQELQVLVLDLRFDDWPMFFRQLLNNPDAEIKEKTTNFNNIGLQEILYQLLKEWQNQKQLEATKDKIIDAFKAIGREDLADKYKKLWKIHFNGSTINGHCENGSVV